MRLPLLAALPLLLAAAGPDAFDRVVVALGSNYKVAQTLAETAARPLETDDLAAGAKVATYRNRALGPAYRKIAVRPGATVRFEQTFFAGQRARIAVVPIDRAAFALEVTDDDGQPQCGAGPVGRCDWVPLWTTRYRIALDNPGPQPAAYFVVMQ